MASNPLAMASLLRSAAPLPSFVAPDLAPRGARTPRPLARPEASPSWSHPGAGPLGTSHDPGPVARPTEPGSDGSRRVRSREGTDDPSGEALGATDQRGADLGESMIGLVPVPIEKKEVTLHRLSLYAYIYIYTDSTWYTIWCFCSHDPTDVHR